MADRAKPATVRVDAVLRALRRECREAHERANEAGKMYERVRSSTEKAAWLNETTHLRGRAVGVENAIAIVKRVAGRAKR